MKIKNWWIFIIGILILIILAISYFINVEVDSGANFKSFAPLLGILIFYNPILLFVYIIIALFLIYKSFGIKIKLV